MRIYDSSLSLEDYTSFYIASEGKTLEEFFNEISNYKFEIGQTSMLQDCIFEDLYGEIASAVAIFGSNIIFVSQN